MSTAPLKLVMPLPWLKKLGLGLTFCGPWALVALALVEKGAVGQQAIAQMLAWGPAALILIGLYLLAERWAPRMVGAQTKLAEAVAAIADRGDRDARETIGLVKFTYEEMQRMHLNLAAQMASLRQELRGKGGANAHAD